MIRCYISSDDKTQFDHPFDVIFNVLERLYFRSIPNKAIDTTAVKDR
jgi:hypothetical protein